MGYVYYDIPFVISPNVYISLLSLDLEAFINFLY